MDRRTSSSRTDERSEERRTSDSKMDECREEHSESQRAKPGDSDDPLSVKWALPIDGFFTFLTRYRQLIQTPLGGTRTPHHGHNNPTLSTVLSIGPQDDTSSFPQRISLSNFRIGSPICSFGCIVRSADNHYLLIKRNESVSYVDFIRGNYRESSLFFILSSLPQNERSRILSSSFDDLWVSLHRKPATGEAYDLGYSIFKKIQPHLPELFQLVPSHDPLGKDLWLFPKGRPEYSLVDHSLVILESPFQCALREFTEETNGLTLTEEHLIFSDPIVEKYLGSNSKNYQTSYFVFQIPSRLPITPFPRVPTVLGDTSLGECDQILWVPLSELSNYLTPPRQTLIDLIESRLPAGPATLRDVWSRPPDFNEIPPDTYLEEH